MSFHRPLQARIAALALACCLAGALLPAASVADELAQIGAEHKAKQWEKARDRSLQLLTARRAEFTDSQAATCYDRVRDACRKMDPVDTASMLKGLDALLAKPDMPVNGALALAINSAAWAMKESQRGDLAAEVVDRAMAYTKGEPCGLRGMYYLRARHLCAAGKTAEAAELYHKVVRSEHVTGPLAYFISGNVLHTFISAAKVDGDWDRAAIGWVHTMSLWKGTDVKYNDRGESPLFHQFRVAILPNLKEGKEIAKAAQLAAQCVPGSIRTPLKSHELQKAIVLLHVQAGQKEQAVAAAKTLYQTCPPDGFDAVVDYIADMLKRMDGSIARANRFLDYVKSGTVGLDGKLGTEDDAVNPFPETVGEMAPTVAAAYREALEGEWQETWEDKRCLAMLYRYMNEPEKALKLLANAFAIAPMKPEPLQLVAGDMTNVLIQLTGNPADGDRLGQFLKFGKEGRDGKAGTEDDVVDPREPYLKQG